MMKRLPLAIVTIVTIVSSTAFAALPDPDIFGESAFIHFGVNGEIETRDNLGIWAWLGKMGIGVRMVFPRGDIQEGATTFNWTTNADYPEGYESSFDDFDNAGVPMIWSHLDDNAAACGVGNESYWDSAAGATCEMDFVEDMARQAGDNHPTTVIAFDIRNEPNLSGFWGGTVAQFCDYVTDYKAAIAAGWAASSANGVHPVPPILGPSTSGTIAAGNFGQQVLEQCGDEIDIIGHHNYFSKHPTSSERTPGRGGLRGQFVTMTTAETAEGTLGASISDVFGMTEGFGVDTYNNNPFNYDDSARMFPTSYIMCQYSRYTICGLYNIADARNVDNQVSDKHYGWTYTTGLDFEKIMTPKPVYERLELLFTDLKGWRIVRNFNRSIANMDDYGRICLSQVAGTGTCAFTSVLSSTRRILEGNTGDPGYRDTFAFLYWKGGKLKLVTWNENIDRQPVLLPELSSVTGSAINGTTTDTTQYYNLPKLQIIELKGTYDLPGDPLP